LQCKKGCPELYLYDLGSSHGTMLNGKPIDARTFQVVRVGEQLQFCADQPRGPTSCLAVICGPEEAMVEEGEVDLAEFREQAAKDNAEREKAMQADLERRKQAKRKRMGVEALAKRMAAVAQRQQQDQKKLEAKSRAQMQEVTWGMCADAVEPQPLEGLSQEALALLDATGSLDLAKVREARTLTEKQQALLQKAEQKQRRVANLHREKQRIEERAIASAHRAAMAEKDIDELPERRLSDGKKSLEQIENLEAKIAKAEEELSEQLDNIMLSLGLKKERSMGKIRKKMVAFYDTSLDDEGADDFFDRTRKKTEARDTKAENEELATELIGLPELQDVENRASLEAKSQKLQAERTRLTMQLAAERAKERSLAAATEKPDEDSLDAFMGSNVEELRRDRRAKLQHRLDVLNSRLSQAEKMLRVARRNADDGLQAAPAPTPPSMTKTAAPKPAAAAAATAAATAAAAAAAAAPAEVTPSAVQPEKAVTPPAVVTASTTQATSQDEAAAQKEAPERPKRGPEKPSAAQLAQAVATKLPVSPSSDGAAAQAELPDRPKRGPERPSAAQLAQATATKPSTGSSAETSLPQQARRQPAPRGLIDPHKAGLQLPLGPVLQRKRTADGADTDTATMPPPAAMPQRKERRVLGPARPSPELLAAAVDDVTPVEKILTSRDSGAAASGEEDHEHG